MKFRSVLMYSTVQYSTLQDACTVACLLKLNNLLMESIIEYGNPQMQFAKEKFVFNESSVYVDSFLSIYNLYFKHYSLDQLHQLDLQTSWARNQFSECYFLVLFFHKILDKFRNI